MIRQCPCCKYFTIDDFGNEITFEICKICRWQYDLVCHEKPNTLKGANKVTLNQAKRNYNKFGASELRLLKFARKPKKSEIIKREKPKKYKNKRKF